MTDLQMAILIVAFLFGTIYALISPFVYSWYRKRWEREDREEYHIFHEGGIIDGNKQSDDD